MVEERIFEPLSMTRSTLDQPLPEHLQPRLVSNYSASSRTPAPFDFVGLAPAGSASASPNDMGRFLAMLMTGGRPRVLSLDALGLMTQLQQPLGPGIPAGLGLGFIVGEYRGVDALVAWRDPSRGVWAAAGKAATACAAVAIVWLFFAFDFATISF